MLHITDDLAVPGEEITIEAVRSQGAGGQNVNKVATAVQLRFDIGASSLPPAVKERLLRLPDHRITADGVVVLKVQQFRTQEQNRAEALNRLRQLIARAAAPVKSRRPTKPTFASRQKRLAGKAQRSRLKALRRADAE